MLSRIGRLCGSTFTYFARSIAGNKFAVFSLVVSAFLANAYFNQVSNYEAQIFELKRSQYEWNQHHAGRSEELAEAIRVLAEFLQAQLQVDPAHYNGKRYFFTDPDQ